MLLSKYSKSGLMFKYSSDRYMIEIIMCDEVNYKIAKCCLKYTSENLR